jgi:uncharacterized protein (DUF1499 family)
VADVSTDPSNPPVIPASPVEAVPAEPGDVPESSSSNLAPRIYRLPIAQVYGTARALVEDRGWQISREVRPPSLPAGPEENETPAAGAEDEAVLEALRAKAVMTQSRSEVAAAVPRPTASEPPPPVEVAAIEAIAPTLIFAFPDPIVLRFRTDADGTRVDMRSASAIGRHDLGQNARRIGAFLAALDAAVLTAVASPDRAEPASASAPQPDAPTGR